MKMSGDDFCCVRKFAEDKNFAPKQDESECPMTNFITGQKRLSSFRAKVLACEKNRHQVKN